MKQRAKKKSFSPLLLVSECALLICGFSSLLLLGMVSVQAADLSKNMAECAKIEDGGERLKCYDQLAGRNSRKMEGTKESTEKSPKEREEESYFSRL